MLYLTAEALRAYAASKVDDGEITLAAGFSADLPYYYLEPEEFFDARSFMCAVPTILEAAAARGARVFTRAETLVQISAGAITQAFATGPKGFWNELVNFATIEFGEEPCIKRISTPDNIVNRLRAQLVWPGARCE